MLDKPRILPLFLNSFNKFNNTLSTYVGSTTYEGHQINRENFLIIQQFVPVKHRKCNHSVEKLVGHAAAYPKLCWKVRSFVA